MGVWVRVEEAMAEIQTTEIENAAQSTPVDLESLRGYAKSPAAKHLYVCFTDYSEAMEAYVELCTSVGTPANVQKSAKVQSAEHVVEIFHAVQSLTRSLKSHETRASVCADAKKAMKDSLPSPLMLLLQGAVREGAGRKGSPSVASEKDIAEVATIAAVPADVANVVGVAN